MCVIDETIAFMGGLDLCYGRWDTSQHVLIDEDHSAPDGPDGPVWRGKDYSNERVVEYYELNKPFDDMIDRKKVPRMPWYVHPNFGLDRWTCRLTVQARRGNADRGTAGTRHLSAFRPAMEPAHPNQGQ